MDDGPRARHGGFASVRAIAIGRSPAAGTRLYVVGDIHGRLDLLRQLHEQILDDATAALAPRNVVVYVGDYVDRGPESRGVLDELIERPLAGFESVHLRGNHEAEMIRFFEGGPPQMRWLEFGGIETLASYGIRAMGAGRKQLQRALAEALPGRHERFLNQLFAYHIEGEILIVHAGLRPGVALEAQEDDDLLWIRDPFLLSDHIFDQLIVHGHTITPVPEIRPNRIGIDTGAFRSGKLTCAVLEGGQLSFLQT